MLPACGAGAAPGQKHAVCPRRRRNPTDRAFDAGVRQWGLLACTLFAALALGALGGRWATRVGLAMVGAWLGIAASAFLQQEFWFVAWAAAATYVSYVLGDISRLSGAGRLGMIAFFVGKAWRWRT